MDVYPYDKWTAKEILNYERDTHFEPTEIAMPEGQTSAPSLLTEADLIGLMEKHGIGTDATHAEHINTIKTRGYIGVRDRYLVPGLLGMGLVEGYDSMNLPLAQPELRAELEADLKRIAEGRRDPAVVLREQVDKYREVYRTITERALTLDRSLGLRFNAEPQAAPVIGNGGEGGEGGVSQLNPLQEVMRCQKCNRFQMILKRRTDRGTSFITCLGFPDCKSSIWFGEEVKEVRVTDETCTRCGQAKRLRFKFKSFATNAMFNCLGAEYTSCVVCDRNLREVLDIRLGTFTQAGPTQSAPVAASGRSAPNSNSRPAARTAPTTASNNNSNRNVNTVLMSRPVTTNSNATAARAVNRNNNIPSNPPPAQRRAGAWDMPATDNGQPGTSRGWNLPQSRDGRGDTGRPNNCATNNNKRRIPADADEDEEKCPTCNGPVKRLITRKEGPNQGRPFFVCAKPSDPCNYFKWADVAENIGGRGGGAGSGVQQQQQQFEVPGARGWGLEPTPARDENRGGYRNGNRGGGRGGGGETQRQARKCGLCRQEGHTRNNCPNN